MTKAGLLPALIALLLVGAGCDDDSNGTPAATQTPSATVTATPSPSPTPTEPPALRVGVAAVAITPCGANPDWQGPITASGVWGEEFTDRNGDGLWNSGEPFVDDPVSSSLDAGRNGAIRRYNGIFLSGFGSNRLATGCNDDLWARTIIIESGDRRIAMTSVDLIGYLKHGTYYGFQKAIDGLDPSLAIDNFIFSSTHQHQGPDTIGLWGFQEFSDGKFPAYLAYVDRMVARSITQAVADLKPVSKVYAMTTNSTQDAALQGLQVRTGCRPPWFFDQELRALRFAAADDSTLATVINWNTHPESLEDQNTLVSSDFVHYIRAKVEAELGGKSVYFSGDLGAAEIVGDTCVGGADPRQPDGSNEFDRRDDIGVPRTQALGETVANVLVDRLRAAAPIPVASAHVDSVQYFAVGTNEVFSFGTSVGILDLDPRRFDPANCPGNTTGLCAPVEQHVVSLRDAAGTPLVQMVTAPGETFPELFYGVSAHRRRDCPAADTGRPEEPSVRDAMTAAHRWFIGLSPDQFGYIVPGYDFYANPALGTEAKDPCGGQEYFPGVPRRRVPDHYHESLAVSAQISYQTVCHSLRLLGRSDIAAASEACVGVFPNP